MPSRIPSISLLFLAWFVLLGAAALAAGTREQETGNIQGRVLDETGAPVPNAAVLVCVRATGIPLHPETLRPFVESMSDERSNDDGLFLHRMTDEEGAFAFDSIPAGEYRLISQTFEGEKKSESLWLVEAEAVRLRGTADRVIVPSSEAGQVILRPLGDCSVRVTEDYDGLYVAVSAEPLCADPVLAFAGWQGAFLKNFLGWIKTPSRLPREGAMIHGLPEGTVHLAAFVNDNNPGFGEGAIETSPDRTAVADLSIVADWSDARHDPPERLVPLLDRCKENPELLNVIRGQIKQPPSPDELKTRIELPGGGEAEMGDLLAVAGYLSIQKALEKRAQAWERKKSQGEK